MTKEVQKTNHERVKADQKLLDQQATHEKNHKLEAAKTMMTWAGVEAAASDLKGAPILHMRTMGSHDGIRCAENVAAERKAKQASK